MFQQHKLLMDSGFSYDQASLILEITERRAAPQPADAGIRSEDASRDTLPPAPTAADSSTSIATSSVSAEPTSTDEIQQQQQQQQQQQPGLKGVEDRLRPSSSSSSSGRAVPGGVPGPDGFYGNYPAGYGPGFDFDPRFSPGYTAGFEQGYEQGLMGPEGGQAGDDDDLAPYEPSGWAVAGTVLVVYAGVLLTFFALLAGAGDVGAAVDPADVMLWW
ncbi:hypothetical protein OEZ86_006813 [Tetradesmus obliquus]|nr:hypothetical protein OEZ86_006813 [Tetradesmus obliquus]